MIVGGYSLHLYCEHPDAKQYVCPDTPGEFTGETRAEAVRDARRHGWIVRPGHEPAVLCPKHAGTSGPAGSSK